MRREWKVFLAEILVVALLVLQLLPVYAAEVSVTEALEICEDAAEAEYSEGMEETDRQVNDESSDEEEAAIGKEAVLEGESPAILPDEPHGEPFLADGIWYATISNTAAMVYNGGEEHGAPSTVVIRATVSTGSQIYTVRMIGEGAFTNMHDLKYITIPDTVRIIGPSAFYQAWDLLEVDIPDSVTGIGKEAFSTCLNLATVSIGSGVKTIGDYAFHHCESLTKIVVPDNVTDLGLAAFQDCCEMTTAVLGKGIETIHDSTFQSCTYLQNFEIPKGVKAIESGAFAYCAMLKNIVIPNGVQTISPMAFYGCLHLKSVTFPASVNFIDYEVLSDCNELEKLICYAVNPPATERMTFRDAGHFEVVVPYGSKVRYEAAENWKDIPGVRFTEMEKPYVPSGDDGGSSSKTAGTTVFTGNASSPITNGTWTYVPVGNYWTFATTQPFRNTWGCIANVYAGNVPAWFFFDGNGIMLTGWQWITDKDGVTRCYYLNPVSNGTLGACQMGGVTPDGYTLDPVSGAWTISGIVQTR